MGHENFAEVNLRLCVRHHFRPVKETCMSARHKAMGSSNINSCESLQLAYAMADVAARLHGFAEIDRFARTGWLPDGFFRLLRKFYAIFDQ